MRTFFAEAVLDQDGTLTVDRLPFVRGEAVQVYIEASNSSPTARESLRGTVLKFDQPFEPIAQDDWAAGQ